MQAANAEQAQELEEPSTPVDSDSIKGIPDVIWLLAWVNFIASLVLIVFGLMGAPAFLPIIGAVGIIATPFLLAVADVVKSLRQIAVNTAKGHS